MTAAATTIMISGTPIARRPEITVFHDTGRSAVETSGISAGAASPRTNSATPHLNRRLRMDVDVASLTSLLLPSPARSVRARVCTTFDSEDETAARS